MKQLRSFSDSRLGTDDCTYCGGTTSTHDHVPSRVFLDAPYPDNLPTVPCCEDCNQSFSRHEEYASCAIDVIVSGTEDFGIVRRDKTKRSLQVNRGLSDLLRSQMVRENNRLTLRPNIDAVHEVLLKLACGHCAYELGEVHHDERAYMWATPLVRLEPEQRQEFEFVSAAESWPEVGSRAMQRVAEGDVDADGWISVQAGRCRYAILQNEMTEVRIVIGDYLAGAVTWGS